MIQRRGNSLPSLIHWSFTEIRLRSRLCLNPGPHLMRWYSCPAGAKWRDFWTCSYIYPWDPVERDLLTPCSNAEISPEPLPIINSRAWRQWARSYEYGGVEITSGLRYLLKVVLGCKKRNNLALSSKIKTRLFKQLNAGPTQSLEINRFWLFWELSGLATWIHSPYTFERQVIQQFKPCTMHLVFGDEGNIKPL